MTFHVGQRVVCVDASASAMLGGHPISELCVGAIYEVRWVGRGIFRCVSYDGIRVVGLVRPRRSRDLMDDVPFAASRFRLVVERKTDISIFTAMLDGAPAREPENACGN
jgi:hypothetical protein